MYSKTISSLLATNEQFWKTSLHFQSRLIFFSVSFSKIFRPLRCEQVIIRAKRKKYRTEWWEFIGSSAQQHRDVWKTHDPSTDRTEAHKTTNIVHHQTYQYKTTGPRHEKPNDSQWRCLSSRSCMCTIQLHALFIDKIVGLFWSPKKCGTSCFWNE